MFRTVSILLALWLLVFPAHHLLAQERACERPSTIADQGLTPTRIAAQWSARVIAANQLDFVAF